MAKLKIAVLGVGNIGTFHVREFINAGAEVVATLGSSRETAVASAEKLRSQFHVAPKAYSELDSLLGAEHLDAVSICTPSRMHYTQVKKCLEAGLHVLCEKPLVLNSYADNHGEANELVGLSEKQGKILTVNTQWPSVLDAIKNQTDLSKLKSFSMQMQPETLGVDMLTEALAHPNSMVVKLIPGGHAEEIKFEKHSKEDIGICFKYVKEDLKCDVHYKFIHKAERPRKVVFSFNGLEWRRELGENYQQRLVTDNMAIDIEDPFRVSIGRFVGAVEGKGHPLVGKKEVIENMVLQDSIVAAYLKQ